MSTSKVTVPGRIFVPKAQWSTIEIVIRGIAHLICNNWQTKHGEVRESRIDPKIFGQQTSQEQFSNALYTVEGREDWTDSKIGKYGMPAYLVRLACLSAAKSLKDWDLVTAVRGCFFTDDVIAPISKVKPLPRKDNVNVDIRHRGSKMMMKWRAQFDKGWEMTVPAKLDKDHLSVAQLASLLERAGTTVGIGEWRPEREGKFGKFRLMEISEIDA